MEINFQHKIKQTSQSMSIFPGKCEILIHNSFPVSKLHVRLTSFDIIAFKWQSYIGKLYY